MSTFVVMWNASQLECCSFLHDIRRRADMLVASHVILAPLQLWYFSLG